MLQRTFASTARIGLIGSYNLDPRSGKLNTEMGAVRLEVRFGCVVGLLVSCRLSNA